MRRYLRKCPCNYNKHDWDYFLLRRHKGKWCSKFHIEKGLNRGFKGISELDITTGFICNLVGIERNSGHHGFIHDIDGCNERGMLFI